MKDKNNFDVIIIGGSYAGLSAAMTLGRSLRSVLIIDSGSPCNRQTPHSHNFITQDGATPSEIAQKARSQVLKYKTVNYLSDKVVSAQKTTHHFKVGTAANQFTASKLLFATGVKDLMPPIEGFSESWGIRVLHCPYCHGYEVKNTNTGILANGETAFELCKLIQHWTDKLTLFTNGAAALSAEQRALIHKLNISIVEKEINVLNQVDGFLTSVGYADGSEDPIEAIFSRVPFEQHCKIPIEMGCKTTEDGHIEVDFSQKTTIDGVFCAGDNTTPLRTVSVAAAAGTKAGAFINMELINEQLPK